MKTFIASAVLALALLTSAASAAAPVSTVKSDPWMQVFIDGCVVAPATPASIYRTPEEMAS
jgi:hypothetical protein